jgi:hypothetical protein
MIKYKAGVIMVFILGVNKLRHKGDEATQDVVERASIWTCLLGLCSCLLSSSSTHYAASLTPAASVLQVIATGKKRRTK